MATYCVMATYCQRKYQNEIHLLKILKALICHLAQAKSHTSISLI